MEYDDIINLPYTPSRRHAHMSLLNRAAQFAPFSALTGYDDTIREAARLTSPREWLSESALETLNEQMQYLRDHVRDHLSVTFQCFEPDPFKAGGRFVTVSGIPAKVDSYENTVRFTDGTLIHFEDIFEIRFHASLPSEWEEE